MGAGASVPEQRALFDALRVEHQLHEDQHAAAKVAEGEWEGSGEDMTPREDEEKEAYAQADAQAEAQTDAQAEDCITLSPSDRSLLGRATDAHSSWLRGRMLRDGVLACELTQLEVCLEKAFETGLTPLILDSSPDDKVCTFFSYQPDVVLLEAKTMIMTGSFNRSGRGQGGRGGRGGRGSRASGSGGGGADKRGTNTTHTADAMAALEQARRALVTAMKFGKLLVIRLGTTAPDFVHCYSDQALFGGNSAGANTEVTEGEAFFPLEVFVGGGKLLHEGDAGGWGVDKSSKIRDEDVKGRISSVDISSNSMKGIKGSSKGSSKGIKGEVGWAERLFREEDMKPHRNFALCRREFRVCVTSQLPIENIDEFLFGWGVADVVQAVREFADRVERESREGSQERDSKSQESQHAECNRVGDSGHSQGDSGDLPIGAPGDFSQDTFGTFGSGHLPPKHLFKIISVLSEEEEEEV